MKRLALLAGLLAAPVQAQQVEPASGAVLRALDKFSGQVVDITMETGRVATFGRLSIALRECRYPAGNPAGNAYASVQIGEEGRDGLVFAGWMIASSPALSAMEHPRYDVWVMRCTTS
ncbi:MAG: DUF2155 domain-containing protein [Pseudomonadota bacterium]